MNLGRGVLVVVLVVADGLLGRRQDVRVRLHIEDELVLRVREALLELALDGAVARADAGLDDSAKDGLNVGHMGELEVVEVMQELGPDLEIFGRHAGSAWEEGGVEGDVVEPQTVDSLAKGTALGRGQEAAVFVVVVPVLDWVDVHPACGDASDTDDLLDERDGDGHEAGDVRELALVVGEELDGIVERAVLPVDSIGEVDELVGLVDVPHAFACRGQGEERLDVWGCAHDVFEQFAREVVEGDVGVRHDDVVEQE